MTGISDNLEIRTLSGSLQVSKTWLQSINPDAIIYTGLITPIMKKYFRKNPLISFLEDEEVRRENNLLTKEGIMQNIKNHKKDNICILGYGHIGKLLYEELKNYQVRVGIKEQKDKNELGNIAFYTDNIQQKRKILAESDLIINTVSEPIVDKEDIENSKAYFLDIASKPYGIREENRKYCQNYKLYSNIPATYNPTKAGKILLKKLKKDKEENK